MGNVIWKYQQPKVDKRLAKSWQRIVQKVGKCWQKRRSNFGSMSAQHRLNFGSTSAQCWLNVGSMSAQCWLNVNSTLAQRWLNVSLTLAQRWARDKSMLGRCQPDHSPMVGATLAQLIDVFWAKEGQMLLCLIEMVPHYLRCCQASKTIMLWFCTMHLTVRQVGRLGQKHVSSFYTCLLVLGSFCSNLHWHHHSVITFLYYSWKASL